jgi:hypothetical protein
MAFVLSAMLASSMSLIWHSAASAATLRYYSGQESPIITLNVPIKSVGGLALPNGRLDLSQNEVQIQAVPEGLFDTRGVIFGVIVTSTPVTEKSTDMRALCYFYAGPWLNALHFRPMSEMITTVDGKIYDGQVVDGDDKSLTFRRPDKTTLNLPFSQISAIDSPRALWLDVPLKNVRAVSGYQLADANQAVFEPTGRANQQTLTARAMVEHPALLGYEPGIKNGSLGAYLAADLAMLVLPAIAIPIVFARQYPHQQALLFQSDSASQLNAAQLQSLVNRFGF